MIPNAEPPPMPASGPETAAALVSALPVLLRLACHHCGLLPLWPAALATWHGLARAQAALPIALVVTSGYRCPWHNAETPGAAWNSGHQLGTALDVLADAHAARALTSALRAAGFSYFETHATRGYIHAERRPD